MVILTENLAKNYGCERGIRGIDLEVKEGEIYVFLGPNGAGIPLAFQLLRREQDFRHRCDTPGRHGDPPRRPSRGNHLLGSCLQQKEIYL